jgi:hypothetical protein
MNRYSMSWVKTLSKIRTDADADADVDVDVDVDADVDDDSHRLNDDTVAFA